MKHLDYFDGAFYINLDRRVDRRESFEIKSNEAGLDIPRFKAIELSPDEAYKRPEDPEWHKKASCTASHQECIKIAKSNNWESILIFEDDAIFDTGFKEKAKKCIADLKEVEWDMFFFGGEPNDNCTKITDNIYKTHGVYGAHAYAIHSNFYENILNFKCGRDIIDLIYLNYHKEGKRFYIAGDLLVWQDDDKYPSDLWVKSGSENVYREAYKKYIR
jgi:GR25 family glycosyltransferase involved in LPS biosynthesis